MATTGSAGTSFEAPKLNTPTTSDGKECLDSLIKAQYSLRDQMTKFISNTKKTAVVKRTHGFYIGRVNGWHDLWQKFLANEDKINQIKTTSDLQNSYFKDDLYSQLEESYYEVKGELVDNLEKLEKVANQTTGLSNPHLVSNNSLSSDTRPAFQNNLPKIVLPKFSGNYTEWLSFRDLFTSVIHTNSGLEDVQKLHYLKTTVVGEAAQVISQFSITNANYQSAWSALTQRYENKRVLVSSLLKALTSQPKVVNESAQAIKKLLDVTRETLSALNNLQVNTVNWDPLLIHLLSQKIPLETLKAWEESSDDSTKLSTWEEFSKFLEFRFRTLEAISGAKSNVPSSCDKRADNNIKQKIQSFHAAKFNCQLCQENHSLRSCPRFLKLDVKSRQRVAKSKGYCTNCLGRYHSINKCLSKARCSECGAKHHTMLHNLSSPNSRMKVSHEPEGVELPNINRENFHKLNEPSTSTSNVLTYLISENRQVLLATALIYVETKEGLKVARALIDPGSQATFITNAALKRMKISTINTAVKITGLGNQETASSRKMANLIIKNLKGDKAVQVTAIALDTLTGLLPSQTIPQGKWDHVKDLHLADPMFYKPNRIEVIIGADIYPLILLDGVKHGVNGSPMAQNTIFGWILSGQVTETLHRETKPQIVSFINLIDINASIKRFWEIEEVKEPRNKSPDEILCENIYKKTHYRKPDGSYVVRLPFKPLMKTKLGASRHIAIKRLLSTETTAERKGFLNEYNEVLSEYLTSGHMELVYDPETNPEPQDVFSSANNYFPHHAVFKSSSTTTKLRVVFDASCKTSNGNSLNDILLTGPTLQQDIITIIMKWRFHKYVFTADIEKMYRQIWIHPDDVNYQKIVWRPKKDEPVREYRLLTVTFGVACAPYLAIRTLHQLADDERTNFPSAAKCLREDFYVDDVLTGSHSLESLNSLKDNLIKLLRQGGFHLRKFSSNNRKVLASLPKEDVSKESLLEFPENPSNIKALGIVWNPKTDHFQYKLNIDLTGPNTKRNTLSKIAKLFDPLGWLSPIVIAAKIFMQKLWLARLDWDEELPGLLNQEWEAFKANLRVIEEIRIPRWINCSPNAQIQFHGFCDSSERAYAACIYARSMSESGETTVHLLISKTKVAPIKTISLPRLELCGAQLLSKLVRNLRQNVDKMVNFTLWTDSTVVLAWLNSHPNKWKSFVANRVTEIHSNTEDCKWRHVPSRDNPADLASRGLTPAELKEQNLWWNGPTWLDKPESEWPVFSAPLATDQSESEAKRVQIYNIRVEDEQLIIRFSNLTRAIRVIAYCYRFFKCTKDQKAHHQFLSNSELENARNILIKESQRYSFFEEIEDLKRKNKVSKKSSLLGLNPFLDENGLLRVGGRLEHSNLKFSEKHPIILDHNTKLTSLLVESVHKSTMHGGINLMLYTLRRTYWIIGIKTLIKKHIHKCITCIRWKGKAATQIMGNLPRKRVIPEKPFTNVGIDYAGPVQIKLSKTRNAKSTKAYIAIFVCLSVKAVHLELVSDLSSEAFLAALRRFFSRRGLSKNIYSDNGTNFVGAAKVLDRDIKVAVTNSTACAAEYYATQGIRWHFIPPSAPHFGGLWEAGVKSMKHHLRRIIGKTLLTFEELYTILTQIEAVLNSRPLCPLTNNPEELDPLTPGHFLIGETLLSYPEADLINSKISTLSRWQLLQKLKQDFWKRWSSEYLSRLQQRPKWREEQREIRVGELVLLKETNLPPSAWKLGRIVEIHKGEDNHTRVVTVNTLSGPFKRPIAKICPLPYDTEA